MTVETGDVGVGFGVKAARQRRIVRLLEERRVASQNELARLLRAAGYRATQATVSRDLEELGVVKIRRDGQIAYALASAGLPADGLSLVLTASVLAIETSGNLIVVHTPPGHAQMVAGALDRSALEGVAGTVAGDDTILVVVRQDVWPREIEQRLRSLAGMPQRLASTSAEPERVAQNQPAVPEQPEQEEAEAER
ncbi:MAG TPA: arginine repressor [Actinomycetota bacterium]|jgi:transcriptional regulator of arginine metabolism